MELLCSTAVTILGVVISPPTGGLSLAAAAAGLVLLALSARKESKRRDELQQLRAHLQETVRDLSLLEQILTAQPPPTQQSPP